MSSNPNDKPPQGLLDGFIRRKPRLSTSREVRIWSNRELRAVASQYSGSVINVSAWKDQDKEGGCYRDYFNAATSYAISNYSGWRGTGNGESYVIDLEQPLPPELVQKFDVAFNHTTLEHIFNVVEAFQNLCLLSRDTVILVVPFQQHLHGPEDGDFWRMSPFCVRRLFARNGFTVLYESAGMSREVVYLFYIASRHPERWVGKIPSVGITDPSLGQYT